MSKRSGKLTVRNANPYDFERCFPLLELLYHGDMGRSFKDVFNKFASDKGSCVLIAEQHGEALGVLIGSYNLDIDWEGSCEDSSFDYGRETSKEGNRQNACSTFHR